MTHYYKSYDKYEETLFFLLRFSEFADYVPKTFSEIRQRSIMMHIQNLKEEKFAHLPLSNVYMYATTVS